MSGWAFHNIGTMSGQAVGIDSGSINLSSWDSTSHYETTYGATAQAFTGVEFAHDPGNNRVNVKMYKGNNSEFATVYYSYVNYTGLASATWEAKYEYATTYGDPGDIPTQTLNTYYPVTTSYIQFYWGVSIGAGYGGAGFVSAGAGDVVFTLRATLGATTYTVASVNRGTVAVSARSWPGDIP